MSSLKLVLIQAAVFIFSVIVTGLLRQYSLKHAVIDMPNQRSSHSVPTPRGGGLSICLSILIASGMLYFMGLLPGNYFIAMAGGGAMVGMIGWLDDHRDLPAVNKAAGYTLAVILSVTSLGGLEAINFSGYRLEFPVLVNSLAIVGMVWLLNLYNFMDGTDALAALETITVGVFTGILFMLSDEQGLAVIGFSVASAAAGFLYWNWPPAKIFMGDVGSCYIGFIFGVLALLGEKTGSIPVMVWIILLSVFICDATFTLVMRLIKREIWHQAHRSHAYQRLVQMNMSHTRLAVLVSGLNIFIIWPAAFVAYRWNEYSFYVALIVIFLMYLLWTVIQVHYKRAYNEKS